MTWLAVQGTRPQPMIHCFPDGQSVSLCRSAYRGAALVQARDAKRCLRCDKAVHALKALAQR